MKLEQDKRYLTRSGMITPPLNSRHGGISFDLPDVGDLSSGIRWLPDGRCETAGISSMASDEFDLVAEAKVLLLGEQVYRNCMITRAIMGGWDWTHCDYDGGVEIDENGNDIRDERHGRCQSLGECMQEIDEMYEDGGMQR